MRGRLVDEIPEVPLCDSTSPGVGYSCILDHGHKGPCRAFSSPDRLTTRNAWVITTRWARASELEAEPKGKRHSCNEGHCAAWPSGAEAGVKP